MHIFYLYRYLSLVCPIGPTFCSAHHQKNLFNAENNETLPLLKSRGYKKYLKRIFSNIFTNISNKIFEIFKCLQFLYIFSDKDFQRTKFFFRILQTLSRNFTKMTFVKGSINLFSEKRKILVFSRDRLTRKSENFRLFFNERNAKKYVVKNNVKFLRNDFPAFCWTPYFWQFWHFYNLYTAEN